MFARVKGWWEKVHRIARGGPMTEQEAVALRMLTKDPQLRIGELHAESNGAIPASSVGTLLKHMFDKGFLDIPEITDADRLAGRQELLVITLHGHTSLANFDREQPSSTGKS